METVAEVEVFAEKAEVGSQYVEELIDSYVKIAPVLYAKNMASGGYYKKEVREYGIKRKEGLIVDFFLP